MKIKNILLLIILVFSIFPVQKVLAKQVLNDVSTFKAKVVKIVDQKEEKSSDGTVFIKQRIRLQGLNGKWKGKDIIYDDRDLDLLSSNKYRVGDKVLVNYSPDVNGEDHFYIIDYVRQNAIYWLILLFIISVIAVGKMKGLKSLIVLVLTFFIILKFIVPQILQGRDPLVIAIVGALMMLILSIYIIEGYNRKSSIAIISILITLVITGILSILFTNLARINGYVSEDVMLLVGMTGSIINLKGLFLAGIIIGTLGVLDDVVVAQVSLVEEFKKMDSTLSASKLYFKSMRVGVSHLSSMVNTLFLAYAGVALPLFILFTLRSSEIAGQGQIINNEMISTEIIRTLVGSIGLMLAVPISTILASKFLKNKKK